MLHRLFVAIKPPPAIIMALVAVQHGIAGARWQSAAQAHITLRFIGDVDHHQAEDAAQALGSVTAAPFAVRLAGTGHFGKADRLNAIWAGVEPKDAITALFHKIDHALVRAGLPPEGRAYVPHLTLARFAASTRATVAHDWLAATSGWQGDAFTIDHFALFESRMGKGGSDYVEVARWGLA